MDAEIPAGLEPPAQIAHLWEWFLSLNETRQTGYGLGPITYGEIVAYGQAMGAPAAPWEVEAIRGIDRAFLAKSGSEKERPAKSKSQMVKVTDAEGIARLFKELGGPKLL